MRGVESLLKVFEKHAMDCTVQERSCVAAAQLARRSEDVKKVFIEGHLIQQIVRIMGLHRASGSLQHLATALLFCLLDASSFEEMVSSGCLEGVCVAMEAHPSLAALQTQALQLLGALATTAEVRQRLAKAAGLERALQAMQVRAQSS